MVGIIDFGSYLPAFRYARTEQGKAWDLKQAMPTLVGERTVANYDEDTVTMAVEAALNAIGGHERTAIDALYFASTTAPFAEKSAAATVAIASDLRVARAGDFANSLRASTAALRAALDAVLAASARQVLVTASDMRQAKPGSLTEAFMGDGAAAMLVGSGGEVIAELQASAHVTQELFDTWRLADERYLRTDDESFTDAAGYQQMVPQVLQLLLTTADLKPEEIQTVVAYAPDARNYTALTRKSPLAAAFNREPLLADAGNLGTASVFMQLALVLESAKPGQRIAVIGYGDGADAFLLRVTDAITRRTSRRGVKTWLASKRMLPSYLTSLYFREHIDGRSRWPAESESWTSGPLRKRQQETLLRFHGLRCHKCGSVWWPERRVCYDCGEQSNFENITLKHEGTLAAAAIEWATPTPVLPAGNVVVDTPEGARIQTQMTDTDMEGIGVGTPVEFCLRIFHISGDIPHYGWKTRPWRK
jgi:hydroxymethylglutaryl-CoA synthase